LSATILVVVFVVVNRHFDNLVLSVGFFLPNCKLCFS
jgi:hypothetical protein